MHISQSITSLSSRCLTSIHLLSVFPTSTVEWVVKSPGSGMSEFQCSSPLVIWLRIALLPTLVSSSTNRDNIGIYAHILSFQGLDEIVHAKCLAWYLTPKQYTVNFASPFFKHPLNRIRQKCHNQRCWWQEAWAKQGEELPAGMYLSVVMCSKEAEIRSLGAWTLPAAGKRSWSQKRTDFFSVHYWKT